MASRGKSINLFLMDGDPSGRIKCTLANWTGVAYKIPRTKLETCKGRDDLSQSGVYFLFGASDQTEEMVVYIGQAGVRSNGNGILCRLQEHKRNPDKDYWTEAIVFTTSNNSFGPTEISWLEHRFTVMANEAKRYAVKNGNDPSPGNVTEEKQSELEEFVDYARIVMGTLGHKVFESLTQSADASSFPDSDDKQTAQQRLCLSRGKAKAYGRLTNEGFVVLAGSVIKDITPHCPDRARRMREAEKDNIGADGVLKKDILFNTPSGAGAFVLGTTSNGPTDWKTENGKTLKEIEADGE